MIVLKEKIMNKLTKAEEQVMQYLWQIEKGFLKDILELFPEPKPHTNTISTILKILMEKGFVSHKTFGRQHEYFPLISKENYSGRSIRSLVKNYFEGSYTNAVSFLVEENEISVKDLELLLNELKNKE